jgi:hypothetical protein
VPFRFETPYLDLEIYRLLTILEASPALAGFDGGETDKLKVESLREWEFPEISRIVVSLAAIIRSSWGPHPVSDQDDYYGAALMRRVGWLVPDLENPQELEILDFREACNKVIHAKSVEPETAPAIQATRPPLTGRLVLYGNYREKEWRADLDLKEYAFSALTLNP